MPIDYQQIQTKIKDIGAGAHERNRALEAQRQRARTLLSENADQLAVLRAQVDSAKATDPNIRCALPMSDHLDAHFPAPEGAYEATLIAADGSQINPDRHAAVSYGLLNVGAIVIKPHSGNVPEIFTKTELLFGDELETNHGPLTKEMVALRRDLKERAVLDDLSMDIQGAVVTCTDGPIELWGAKGEDAQSYADFVEKYKIVLSRLQSRGVTTAGYVDKPSADLVIRLLEIASASPEQLLRLREFHPLRGVSDRWLYGERTRPLLPPGHRSAVFALQSGSEKKYTGVLSLRFFYLNVGTDGHPWPVRVEIPAWVANDHAKLNLLHAVLVEQCRILGNRPYPYFLHRAHETAVVSQEEKQQVEQLLTLELQRQGEESDEKSQKQTLKDLPGKTSYARRHY